MEHPRPKRHYRIVEISKLFGIGQDSLRYYERLGILTPHRQANGYRAYDLNDLYKLTIIKDLRRFDMPLTEIGAYLNNQSVEKTAEMLDHELDLIAEEMHRLEERAQAVRRRARELDRARKSETGTFDLVERPLRRCVQLVAHMELDEEMDYAIQKLYRAHEHELPDVGCLEIGATLSDEAIADGGTNIYDSVIFVLEDKTAPADLLLAEGTYLRVRYRGGYGQNGPLVRRAWEYAAAQGLAVTGAPLEFYEIDNRDTTNPAEFISRIEVQVV